MSNDKKCPNCWKKTYYNTGVDSDSSPCERENDEGEN